MQKSNETTIAMKVSAVSIIINLLLSVFKLAAGLLAHSGAMVSDAVHSASDVFSTIIVIIVWNALLPSFLRLSSLQPDSASEVKEYLTY